MAKKRRTKSWTGDIDVGYYCINRIASEEWPPWMRNRTFRVLITEVLPKTEKKGVRHSKEAK